jgi:enterochelin esterase-like enzyme
MALTLAGTACQAPPKRLAYEELALPGSDRVLRYAIYLPPAFSPAEALPLVVFLHGAGDGPDCFDRAGFGQDLDARIAAGELPRMVVVVPQGDLGFWENWADGSYRYRDWVLRELVPHVAAVYGTRPCPRGCHLVGVSMGGHGALRFALLEPGFFASASLVSAPIFDTDDALAFANEGLLHFFVPIRRIWGDPERETIEREDPYRVWTRPEDLAGLRLMLAWGSHDKADLVASNERFERHLSQYGIPHAVLVFAGGHDWKSWKPALARILALQLGGP